jgi:hypothetical protein
MLWTEILMEKLPGFLRGWEGWVMAHILVRQETQDVIPYLIFLIPGPPGGGLRFLSIALSVPVEMNQLILQNHSQNKLILRDGRIIVLCTKPHNSLHLAGKFVIRCLNRYSTTDW